MTFFRRNGFDKQRQKKKPVAAMTGNLKKLSTGSILTLINEKQSIFRGLSLLPLKLLFVELCR